MDQIIQAASTNTAPTSAAPFSHLASSTPATFNIHGSTTIANNLDRLADSPIIQTDFAAPLHIETNFYNSKALLVPYLPARILQTTPYSMTWPDYMMFTHQNTTFTNQWFSRLLPTMNKYTQYFKGSVTLAQLLPTGQGSAIVLSRPVDSAANQNAYNDFSGNVPAVTTGTAVIRHIVQSHNRNFTLSGEHSDIALPDVSAQYAAVTALNMDFTGLTTRGTAFPTAANSRFGPVWNLTPAKQLNPADITRSFGAYIANHYHSETRMT